MSGSNWVKPPWCRLDLDSRSNADRGEIGRRVVMCLRGIVALIIVASVTSFASLPVTAGGWDFTVRPKGEASRAIGVGLQLYGLARGLKNQAQTRQLGADNGAAIRQYGLSNNALIVQRGKGNAANIAQNGSNNAYGIFQFGSGNSKSVVQNSDGGLGSTYQGNR